MTIKSRLRKALGSILGLDALPKSFQILGWQMYGALMNQTQYITEAFQANDYVYSCCSWIAGKAAEAPYTLYKKKNEKYYRQWDAYIKDGRPESLIKAKAIRDRAVEEIPSHPILDMLNDSPNPNMSGSELKYARVLMRLLTGNTYVYGVDPDMSPGKFKSLYILPSQNIKPVTNDILGSITGYYFDLWPEGKIPVENVSHTRYFNPFFTQANPFVVGQSPVQAACNSILASNSGKTAQTKAFQNGGSAVLVYEDGGTTMTDEQRQDLQDTINNKIKGSENFKSVVAASSKMGKVDIGDTLVDMDLISAGLNNMRDICRVFHLPSVLMGDVEGTTFNNLTEARKIGLCDAVLPELTAIREADNKFLIEGWFGKNSGYFLAHDLTVYPELAADMQKVATTLNAMPYLSFNEKRTATDYDTMTDPLMDKIYVPNNLVPIEDLGLNLGSIQPSLDNPLPNE